MPHILTKIVTAYKFSELSPAAKQKVIEKFHDINIDHEWWDTDFEDFTAIGALMGIRIDKIYFTGFSSQGDGACFEGSYAYKKGSINAVKSYAPVDKALHAIAENLRSLQNQNADSLIARVKHSGHYHHRFCTDINCEKNNGNEITLLTEEDLKELLRDFMLWMYKQLNSQHDYLTSDAAIIETIESNEYDFTEEGNFPAI